MPQGGRVVIPDLVPPIVCGSITLHLLRRTATVRGRQIRLTFSEAILLGELLQRDGELVGTDSLVKELGISSKAVLRALTYRLRLKLGDAADIENEWMAGYRLMVKGQTDAR